MEFSAWGKFIIILGILLILLGIIISWGGKLSFWDKLPGDIVIKKENFTLYIPLVTSLLLSIILTLILNLIFRK